MKRTSFFSLSVQLAFWVFAILKYVDVSAQTPLPNPDLVQQCPYDIIFVLDESGSINGQAGSTVISPQIRSGSSTLISSLNGTGSRVAVVEFNSSARRAIIGGSVSYQTVNSSYVTAFNNYVNTDNNNTPNANHYDPEDCNQCFTNWQDALDTVQSINATETIADLVIFFTDGMPTAYYDTNGSVTQGMTAAIAQQALLNSIVAANGVKTQGSHIFVVGIPNPNLPESNVQAISDSDRYPVPESDFLKGDYSVSTSATLQQDLAGLANLLTINTATSGFQYSVTWSNHCDTFMVQFTNTSTGATRYYWEFEDSIYSTDTSLTHLFSGSGPFVVMLSAYNDGICGISDTLYDTISFTRILDTLITDFSYSYLPDCDSLLVQFEGTSSGSATFVWDFGNGQTAGGNSASAVYSTPGIYIVTMIATPMDHCYARDTLVKPFTFNPLTRPALADFEYDLRYKNDCDTFMVQFTNTSTGATRYYWDFGDSVNSTDASLTHLFSGGGPFVVMLAAYNEGRCGINDTLYDTLSFTLTFDTLFSDFSYSYTPDCDSLLVQFEGTSSSGAAFAWDFGNGQNSIGSNAAAVYTTPGTYDVTMIVTPTARCYMGDTVLKPFSFTPLTYTAQADFDYDILYKNDCDTFVVQFNNLSSGGSSYFWNFGNGATSTDSNATIILASGNYNVTLQVNDSRKCSMNDTIIKPLSFVPIITNPVAHFDYRISPDCDEVEFELINQSSEAEKFSWRINDNIISWDFAPNSPLNYYQPANLNVELIAKGANNCAMNDTAAKTITIPAPYGYPVTDFEYTRLNPETDETISFINLSKRADTTRYQWSFGDGSYSTKVNPQHAYSEKGEYEICLSAENEYGCPDQACKSLEVIYTAIVDLPTAFSPNGDDRNDIFIVRGKDLSKIHLKIFNRWGELVFESRDPYVGWDGTYKGSLQEMEVYDWLLNATLKNGQEVFRKGNVTLLR